MIIHFSAKQHESNISQKFCIVTNGGVYDIGAYITVVCMCAVDLQVQRKVVSAYEAPHHNCCDNDLTKLRD
ncbi:hypothetical protein T02_2225 [Trichinella nativa]|uniref:Uncharacterized protein n=1 Tax=Trichinella nativa TaxID=6335 RepID=A0A0V1LG70_9BILA|nr:hypothetical protein T02_2225 [Trichinella nativa]